MKNNSNKIIYLVLTILVAFVFAGSGLLKIFGGDKTAEMAKMVGGHSTLILLGILELVIVALWFIPKTGSVAAFLAMAYMGGAMAVLLVSGQSILVPTVIEILIWVASVYRFPELGQRLLGLNKMSS